MFASSILRSTAALNAAKQVSSKQVRVTVRPSSISYIAGLYAKKVPVVFMWGAFLGCSMGWPLAAEKVVKTLGMGNFA
jgi:hypothetical protein